MATPFFIITAPHVVCLSGSTRTERQCDLVSEESAEYIASTLGASVGFNNVQLIKSSQNRSVLDDNRHIANIRRTRFHEDLRNTALKQSNRRTVLIDVHSFPETTTDLDLFLIALRRTEDEPAVQIAKLLGSKVNIGVATGKCGGNSILEMYTGSTALTMLLEVNESMNADKRDNVLREFLGGVFEYLGLPALKREPILTLKSDLKS